MDDDDDYGGDVSLLSPSPGWRKMGRKEAVKSDLKASESSVNASEVSCIECRGGSVFGVAAFFAESCAEKTSGTTFDDCPGYFIFHAHVFFLRDSIP